MKVGIFSPYFEYYGGGERYMLTVAEFFLKKNNSVDIITDSEINISKIKTRFDIDLNGVNFVPDFFFKPINFFEKLKETKKYDLIFFLSDGSIPILLAKKNLLHFQTPFSPSNRSSIWNRIKLSRINSIICNSNFTKQNIDLVYGVKSRVLYPPVDVEKFKPNEVKENLILTVGRFASAGKAKKQEVMIEAFKKMVDGGLKNWKFILIGDMHKDSEEEVERLKSVSEGFPIELLTNSDFETLKQSYSRSKIYWHAKGFGDDLEKFPQEAEHFGITTVEAMASGCIPVVFRGGGQVEIIDEGKDGLFWQTADELISKTLDLIKNYDSMNKISLAAIEKSKKFSKRSFNSELEKLIS